MIMIFYWGIKFMFNVVSAYSCTPEVDKFKNRRLVETIDRLDSVEII